MFSSLNMKEPSALIGCSTLVFKNEAHQVERAAQLVAGEDVIEAERMLVVLLRVQDMDDSWEVQGSCGILSIFSRSFSYTEMCSFRVKFNKHALPLMALGCRDAPTLENLMSSDKFQQDNVQQEMTLLQELVPKCINHFSIQETVEVPQQVSFLLEDDDEWVAAKMQDDDEEFLDNNFTKDKPSFRSLFGKRMSSLFHGILKYKKKSKKRIHINDTKAKCFKEL